MTLRSKIIRKVGLSKAIHYITRIELVHLFGRYPMEMHLVHIRTIHGSDISAALDPEECTDNGAYCGLAVLGILFTVGGENNTVMDVSSEITVYI